MFTGRKLPENKTVKGNDLIKYLGLVNTWCIEYPSISHIHRLI